jgi:hypothetical protein
MCENEFICASSGNLHIVRPPKLFFKPLVNHKWLKFTKKKRFPGPGNFQISIFVIYFEQEMLAYTSTTSPGWTRLHAHMQYHPPKV